MSLVRTFLAGTAVLSACAAFLAASLAVAYVGRVSAELPDHLFLRDWKPAEGTVITAADGTLMAEHARERRQVMAFEDIPDLLVDAFVAAEDGKYWEHNGVDLQAIARALLANAKAEAGERPEGASTITQQVVKNLVLSNERTLDRKIREALIALRVDRDLGKNRVLEIYLNEIYLGAGAYGVAAAAETYFNKTLDELNLAEAALLAGLPKAPSASNPFQSAERAVARRTYVLRRMVDEGMISLEEARKADREPLPVRKDDIEAGRVPSHFWYPQETVRRMVLKADGDDALYASGQTIQTTIVPEFQELVHRALRQGLVDIDRMSGWRGPLGRWTSADVDWSHDHLQKPDGAEEWSVGVVVEAARDAIVDTPEGQVTLEGGAMGWATRSKRADTILKHGDIVLIADLGHGPELVQLPAVQGAAIAMDPRDGSILALGGGFSHEVSEFNRVTQARRQTGSVFKPFVYMAALELGYDAMSPVLDAPIAIEQDGAQGDWRPSGGSSGGWGLITLRRSLEHSRNLSAVRLLQDVGMEGVVSVAERAGLSLPDEPPMSVGLGAAEATPLEMARAYSAFANGGAVVEPVITTGDGREGDRVVFDPVHVAQLTSMLEGVVVSGTARGAFDGFEERIAAKTGTTNDARDAWFVAYGPEIVVVTWVGFDDHSPLPKGTTGGSAAAPIARRILEGARDHDLVRFPDFPLPEGAVTIRVDRETGTPSPDGDLLEVMRAH